VREVEPASADDQLRAACVALGDLRDRIKDIAVALSDAERRIDQAISGIQPSEG